MLGAFLIPYLIMVVLEGVPIFYLEMLLGQFYRKGPIGTWKRMNEKLVGVGYACAAVSFVVGIYYNVLITWCFWYFFRSIFNFLELPWSKCPTEKDENEYKGEYFASGNISNQTGLSPASEIEECRKSSPTQYFFYRDSLNLSSGIDELGVFNWKMFIALTTAWVVVYVCMVKGIKSSGKVYLSSYYLHILALVNLPRTFRK